MWKTQTVILKKKWVINSWKYRENSKKNLGQEWYLREIVSYADARLNISHFKAQVEEK